MENRKVKTKVNQLLGRYEGNKTRRIESLCKDLHINKRWAIYLLNGEKRAGFHLAYYIDRLHAQYFGE